MVPWYLLFIAGEIGIFIGFASAAVIAFYQISRFNKNISLNILPGKERRFFDVLSSQKSSPPGNIPLEDEKSA